MEPKPVVFVIDPVADFIVKGSSFEVAYGEDDLLPLKNIVHRIEQKIRGDFHRKFLWVLITSIYSKNQVFSFNFTFFHYFNDYFSSLIQN